MKNSFLAVALGLMTTLQGATSLPDKEEPIREHQGYKAVCSAVGTAAGLYYLGAGVVSIPKIFEDSSQVYKSIFGSHTPSPEMQAASKALAASMRIGVGSYVTYTLGYEFLRQYLKAPQLIPKKANPMPEHKAISALKATGSAVGAGAGVFMVFSGICMFLPFTCIGIFKGAPPAKVLHQLSHTMAQIGLGSYLVYKLWYEALPDDEQCLECNGKRA